MPEGTRLRVIGVDPGLRITGWAVIGLEASRLIYVAHGTVKSRDRDSLAERLVQLFDGLTAVIAEQRPDEAAVEETFVNRNPTTTLALGQARAVALLTPARAGLPVFEYTPNLIKKTVVGAGHAAKEQVQAMVRILVRGCPVVQADAADALAIAICHAHHRTAIRRLKAAERTAALATESRP